jgi:hypothetical protein
MIVKGRAAGVHVPRSSVRGRLVSHYGGLTWQLSGCHQKWRKIKCPGYER